MKTFFAAIIAALAVTAPANAATLKGVVVAHKGHTISVAAASGRVTRVKGDARVGARVVASAGHVRVVGRAHRARVRGVVVKRLRSAFLLSAGGKTMLLIRHGRRLADSSPVTGPTPGTVVSTVVEIDDQGDLDEQETDELGDASTVEVEGVLAADVAAGATSIVVLVEHGIPVTVQIPASLKLPAMKKGDEIDLKATVDGTTLTATKVESGDDGEQNDEGDDD